jgi:hypothetical protein
MGSFFGPWVGLHPEVVALTVPTCVAVVLFVAVASAPSRLGFIAGSCFMSTACTLFL